MTQQPAKSQEPSMEEILASIRRIIADDDASKSTPRPPESPKASARAPVGARLSSPAPPQANTGRGEISPVLNGAGGVGEQSSDILDLTESMATSMPSEPAPATEPAPTAPPQFRKIDGHSDVSFAEPGEKPSEAMDASRAHIDSNAGRSDAERAQLLSRETTAAVDSAFNTLAQTVLVQNARTLEDLVREMLRPMLKTWLDDNLPGMVERLVRAEIERVSRGRAT